MLSLRLSGFDHERCQKYPIIGGDDAGLVWPATRSVYVAAA
jgi:hypothetical protein